jgi:hypothetical protein
MHNTLKYKQDIVPINTRFFLRNPPPHYGNYLSPVIFKSLYACRIYTWDMGLRWLPSVTLAFEQQIWVLYKIYHHIMVKFGNKIVIL